MGLGCVLLHFKEAGQAQRVGWGGGILGHTWVGLGRHLGQTEIGRATNKVPEITGGHNQGNKSCWQVQRIKNVCHYKALALG